MRVLSTLNEDGSRFAIRPKVSRGRFLTRRRIVGYARKNRHVFLSILGISWFWLVGGTYLTQFPPFVKDVLHADAAVVNLLLTVFLFGIGAGSFLCNKLLRGQIKSTYVPWGCLGMTLFGDLDVSTLREPPSTWRSVPTL